MDAIKIIYTGGTVGGKEGADRIIQEDLKPQVFLKNIYKVFPYLEEEVEINISTPLKKFSENISPKDWILIAQEVNKTIMEGKYCGIVIAHGTDTMVYTSAALSFLLRGVKIPIIFTGSNEPLENENSDAVTNLHHAIFMSRQKKIIGVFLVFSGIRNQASTIHVGCKVRKVRFYENCYESINCDPIGFVKQKYLSGKPRIIIQNRDLLNKVIKMNEEKKYIYYGKLTEKIAFFKVFPGFDVDIITDELNKNILALILELYNSGTGCVEGPYSLLPALEKAKQKNVPVFIVSQHVGKVAMDIYKSSIEINKMGGQPLGNMIAEAAIPKLMWILSMTKDKNEIIELMLKDASGELL
jgi:L-asparaginase type I